MTNVCRVFFYFVIQLSCLCQTFIRHFFASIPWKNSGNLFHEYITIKMAWPSVFFICLLFQSIRTVLAYTLIRLFFSALLAMTLIPFRGPDFWTEIRVASCDQQLDKCSVIFQPWGSQLLERFYRELKALPHSPSRIHMHSGQTVKQSNSFHIQLCVFV